MNKTITLFIFLIISTIAYTQKKEISLKLKNKQQVNETFINKSNGDIYFRVSRQPSGLLYIYKDNHLLKYNHNLDTVFDLEYSKSVQIPDSKFSGFGYYIVDEKIIDSLGDLKKYPANNFFTQIEKKSNLNPIFSFFNNYSYTIIGPKLGRKNRKSVYDDGDLFIYNFKNSNLKGESFPLVLPNIKTNQKKASWFLLKQKLKYNFFITSKDDLKKDYNKDTYHFVEYNFNGKVISYTRIPISLDEEKNFLPSHNDNGPTVYSNSAYGGSFGYASSFINKSDNTILLYGYYSNKKGKQIRAGKVDGIYAYKYKIGTGELIWKSYYPFSKTNNNYLIKRKIEYSQSKDTGIIHCYLDDNNAFFLINNETGEIEKNSSNLINLFEKSKILKDNVFLNLNMYTGGYFGYTFKDKKTNRNKISISVLKAILLKPEIESFLIEKSKTIKNGYYEAKIIENGDVFIFEYQNRGNEISIYKF